ncbi:F-box/kelch-repeat protein [Senna tora]|uniref:F-box/kelch-repeat protein n=1 Tax=Senna tora TaxID=362788 RepID=A0A834TMJ2_9FABA|nr:F-box/kelch-repeat protein [Senna tora]
MYVLFDNGYNIPPPLCNIMSRLTAHDLINIRCVCKNWNKNCKSPEFIDEHTNFSKSYRSKHILLCDFFNDESHDRQFASIDDDHASDDFCEDFIDIPDFVPSRNFELVGVQEGLLCENKHGFGVDYASGESIIVTFARKHALPKMLSCMHSIKIIDFPVNEIGVDFDLVCFQGELAVLSSKNFTEYLMEFVIWTNPEMHKSRSNWLVHTQIRTIPGGLCFFSLKDYVIYCLPDERNAQNIPYRTHSKIIFFIKLGEQYHDFKQLRCSLELTFTVSKMCNYYLTIRSW